MSPKPVLSVRVALERFDSEKCITQRALALAKARGKVIESHSDAGRSLIYYYGLVDELVKSVGKPKGKSFLHVAGGTGVLTKFLQDRGARAVSFDFDEKLCSIARELGNREVVRGDALAKFPFRSNEFDCLITDHFAFAGYKAIDYLFSEGKEFDGSKFILKEAARVVKPGGVCIVNSIDARISPEKLVELCAPYFEHSKIYAYGHNKQLIPGIVLIGPKK